MKITILIEEGQLAEVHTSHSDGRAPDKVIVGNTVQAIVEEVAFQLRMEGLPFEHEENKAQLRLV